MCWTAHTENWLGEVLILVSIVFQDSVSIIYGLHICKPNNANTVIRQFLITAVLPASLQQTYWENSKGEEEDIQLLYIKLFFWLVGAVPHSGFPDFNLLVMRRLCCRCWMWSWLVNFRVTTDTFSGSYMKFQQIYWVSISAYPTLVTGVWAFASVQIARTKVIS